MTETPTVVLVPGLLCDRTIFERTLARLEPHLPCAVADVDSQTSIEEMAADTLAAHPGPLYVLGHSMGARVAMEMAQQAPERVKKLALADTGIHPYVEGEEVKRNARVKLAYDEGMAALAADWLPGMVHPNRQNDAALMAPLAEMVCRKTPEIHERQINALLTRPDARALLPTLTMPVLVAVGRQDQWSPLSRHEEMVALLPNAHLVVIEDAGHFAPLERAGAFADAVEAWALATDT
ncbi:MAG: alpha/beta hydrolase [Hyphomicrobiales bacterium]|nr:MAG: alpha/beta hydrolase [Hyphomicrobiales bacterium]